MPQVIPGAVAAMRRELDAVTDERAAVQPLQEPFHHASRAEFQRIEPREFLGLEPAGAGRSAAGFLGEKASLAQLRVLRDSGDDLAFDPGVWSEMAEMGWAGIVARGRLPEMMAVTGPSSAVSAE